MEDEKEINKIDFSKKIILTIGIFLLFFGWVKETFAATLFLSPSTKTVKTGSIINVDVYMNTQGVAVNNGEAVINFPKNLLEVISVSKTSSVFSLWVEEPSFSNLYGQVNFNGGLPTPGFTGANGKIITISFRAKSTGLASISSSSAAVRANDGLGTNVLTGVATAEYTIIEEAKPVVPNILVSDLTSSTHPVQTNWYSALPTFEWKLGKGTISVRLGISKSNSSQPTVVHKPAITSRTIDKLEDGIWYFSAQGSDASGWGPVYRYTVQIDSKKPEYLNLNLMDEDMKTASKVKVEFDAFDKTSGIDRYEVALDDGEIILWKDDGNHIFTVPPTTPGKHTLSVKAFDEAGNYLANSVDFIVNPPIITDDSKQSEKLSVAVKDKSEGLIDLSTGILGSIVILLISVLIFGRYKYIKFRSKLRRETVFVSGSLHDAFDTLKQEMEDQIELLGKSKNQSELGLEETRIIKQLRRSLHSAEKTINKDVERLKKDVED